MRFHVLVGSIVLCLFSGSAAALADECSDVVEGALPTPSPNWDRNPYPGMCYVDWSANGAIERDALRDRCSNIPGNVNFEPDSGSGTNTCVFKPGNGSSDDNNSGADSSSSSADCGPGRKLCEGHCIADSASCCANGDGAFCANHGQCCFNPNAVGAHNGYVCCAFGNQCVHEDSPTNGMCVNPNSTIPRLPPQTNDNSRERREAAVEAIIAPLVGRYFYRFENSRDPQYESKHEVCVTFLAPPGDGRIAIEVSTIGQWGGDTRFFARVTLSTSNIAFENGGLALSGLQTETVAASSWYFRYGSANQVVDELHGNAVLDNKSVRDELVGQQMSIEPPSRITFGYPFGQLSGPYSSCKLTSLR
jgi:hypothetical protein